MIDLVVEIVDQALVLMSRTKADLISLCMEPHGGNTEPIDIVRTWPKSDIVWAILYGEYPEMNKRPTNEGAITLGDLLHIALEAIKTSPLGLETVVCLCEMDRETISFKDAKLDVDQDGATFLISLHKFGT